jgi:hypothetical protein
MEHAPKLVGACFVDPSSAKNVLFQEAARELLDGDGRLGLERLPPSREAGAASLGAAAPRVPHLLRQVVVRLAWKVWDTCLPTVCPLEDRCRDTYAVNFSHVPSFKGRHV